VICFKKAIIPNLVVRLQAEKVMWGLMKGMEGLTIWMGIGGGNE
jgi:hypothetical protein